MQSYEQGSILNVDRIQFPVLVISNKVFNSSGAALVCPIMKTAIEGPLHIPLSNGIINGVVLCEQVRYLDLNSRHFSVAGTVGYYDIMDISDAVVSMAEYL